MHLSTAGTTTGLVALQLECSIPGVPPELLAAGLARAKAARLKLLGAQTPSGKVPHSAIL